jgi:ACS family hexuronate transporter-like MFS transporter
LAPADRPLGNGLLQSGASVGPILTPLVVQAMVTGEPGSWRGPFVAVGAIGLLWILPWTWFTAGGTSLDSPLIVGHHPSPAAAAAMQPPLGLLIRRCLALGILVVALNLTWHFFRAWLPKMLEEYYGYGAATVRYFTAGYYLAAGLGCILAGFAVKLLTPRLMAVHRARLTIFLACALLTALSTVVSGLGRGPLLLILLLVVSFGSLGLFPNYYSLTQEISLQHQGKLTGALGFLTWVAIGEMQHLVGQHLDRTHTYAACIFWAGLPPGVAFVALCLLWGGRKRPPMPYT